MSVKMRIKREIHHNDFFLYNNGNGFTLQRAKNNNFTTIQNKKHYDHSGKNDNFLKRKELELKIKREDLYSSSGCVKKRNNKSIKNQNNDFETNLEHPQESEKVCEEKTEAKKEMSKTSFRLVNPKFPDIEERKMRKNVRSFRTIQENEKEHSIENLRVSDKTSNFRTRVVETKRNRIEEEINFLIQQEALRIEMEERCSAVSRKFSFSTGENSKRISPIRVRKRQYIERNEREFATESCHGSRNHILHGPEIRSFNPSMPKYDTKFKNWMKSSPERTYHKYSMPLKGYLGEESGNQVEGWTNEKEESREEIEEDEWITFC